MTDIGSVKGVGEKTKALFHKIGIAEAEDLLRYYPVHYLVYDAPKPVSSLTEGEIASVEGTILTRPGMRSGRGKTIVTAKISDVTGTVHLIWFNAPYVASLLKARNRYIFHGRVEIRGNTRTISHPEIFTPEEYEKMRSSLRPVYALTKGLGNKTVIRTVERVFEMHPAITDCLPDSLRKYLGLMGEEEALRGIHFPADQEALGKARSRLVFDEFFLFILAMRTLRETGEMRLSAFPMKKTWDTEILIEKLPYRLTNAQKEAWRTIEEELCGKKCMNRLIQGDVGSGKTIIAFLAMLMTASNGYQSVLMAPTEVLARQHYEKLLALSGETPLPAVRPVLLIGSLKASEKKQIRERIADGEVNCIIGTQALIQESVHYKNLALVITDEQHRFGVRQRKALSSGDCAPHMIVMSATPIPRTLGIIFYGDLDITVIDEKPSMQLPVKNALVDRSWRPNAYRFIRKMLESGRQAYIICAMVEASDELDVENVTDYTKQMKKEFPEYKVGMLHGQMKPAEKERVMEAFAGGEIRLLVATTVVEVGVDVPNATVIMIEDAERYGLAQLHQLRGRVGRGKEQSYCIFMQGHESETSRERLEALTASNDGFAIAEKDFEMRGPGDLLGIRQSGDLYFTLSDPARDREIMMQAGQTAANILADDPRLIGEEYKILRKTLDEYLTHMEGGIVL